MAYDPTRPADTDLVKKSAELIRENLEGLRKNGIVLAKPPLYGTGVPKVTAGENGDRYIDSATGNHYYKNINGKWDINMSLDDKYKTIKEVAVLQTTLQTAISATDEKLLQISTAFSVYSPYIVGEYKLMAHNKVLATTGFVKSDGGLYNITKYPAAYTVFGTTHGGDGVNTFAVPDWRADAIRINDDGRGIDLERVLGSEQEDAIQNMAGEAGYIDGGGFGKDSSGGNHSGVFAWGTRKTYRVNGEGGTGYNLRFDASRVARTADETRMRNRSCCMYVYIGRVGIDA